MHMLEGDDVIEVRINGLIDGPHTALSDRPDNAVAFMNDRV
jgi:hypothetical protein